MTVKELIKVLKEANPEDIVVLSSDSEGNSYSEHTNVCINRFAFCDESIYYKEMTDALIKEGYAEEDVRTIEDGARSCIVIYP